MGWNRGSRDCFFLVGWYHNGTIEGQACSTTKKFLCEIPPPSGVLKSKNISVTFSEAMDTTSVTTNTDNTTCYGSFQTSSDNFSTCVQMSSSPSSSNSDKTFTVVPSTILSAPTTYKTRVTTGVKDVAKNVLNSQAESVFQGTSFTMKPWAKPYVNSIASPTTSIG